jgi:hypothetical protein
MIELITANGKELSIVNAPGTGHYKIQFKTGGELPEILSGLFTSYREAEKLAVQYTELSKEKQTKPKSTKEA